MCPNIQYVHTVNVHECWAYTNIPRVKKGQARSQLKQDILNENMTELMTTTSNLNNLVNWRMSFHPKACTYPTAFWEDNVLRSNKTIRHLALKKKQAKWPSNNVSEGPNIIYIDISYKQFNLSFIAIHLFLNSCSSLIKLHQLD